MVRWMRLGEKEPEGDGEGRTIQNMNISLKSFIRLTSNRGRN